MAPARRAPLAPGPNEARPRRRHHRGSTPSPATAARRPPPCAIDRMVGGAPLLAPEAAPAPVPDGSASSVAPPPRHGGVHTLPTPEAPWPGPGLPSEQGPEAEPARVSGSGRTLPAARLRTAVAGFGAWTGRHRRSLLLLVPVLIVVGVVHGVGMGSYPAPVDDEGTYMAQAWSVVEHHALTPYTYWYTHPPLGWIQIAGWSFLTDGFRASLPAVESGRQLMLLAFLVSDVLVYVVARRLGMRRGFAVGAAALYGLSPLAVYYGRMAYLDNVAVPWLLASFALALTPRRRLWSFAGAGACFAVAVLSKTTVLVVLPAVLWAAWQTAEGPTRRFCVTALASSCVLVGCAYPLYATLKGELVPGRGHVSLLSAVAFQLSGRASSGSPLTPGTQAHTLVSGWLHIDPWLLGMGVVCIPLAAAVRRLRPLACACLIGAVVVLRGGYLPVPYVTALLPLAALLAAGVGDTLWSWLRRPAGPSAIVRAGRWAARVAGLAGALVLGVAVVPAWADGDRTATTTGQWGPTLAAEHWAEAHIPRTDRLIVGDTMWTDLVEHGFPQADVVWFSKLDYVHDFDPSIRRATWRAFDYVIETPSMRAELVTTHAELAQVLGAVHHSTVVARFGTRGPGGGLQVVIRKIDARATPEPVSGDAGGSAGGATSTTADGAGR